MEIKDNNIFLIKRMKFKAQEPCNNNNNISYVCTNHHDSTSCLVRKPC